MQDRNDCFRVSVVDGGITTGVTQTAAGLLERPGRRFRAITANDTSLNHFVGADDQRWPDFNPQRLCGFEIDGRLILGGVLARRDRLA